jgi:TPR repeat protein/transcriptional regulator with XRE-family HTH domain
MEIQSPHELQSIERLRALLRDGQARRRLTLTQLASRAGLGRTTVSQALSDSGPVPSAATVAALAKVLGLDELALLELRREAPTLGWRLWHPVDPTRAEAALTDLDWIGPQTVVWLNETQHYLNGGEQVASALHMLLSDPTRAPVLVLGTLWPDYDHVYSARPVPGTEDRYARARELLAGRRIEVPDEFNVVALQEAKRLANDGDRLLAEVLGRDHGGRIAQHLAGAPELLRRYETTSAPARALLHAAMDARRLGIGLHLPLEFLADAASGYLHPFDEVAEEDWLEKALALLAEPVHGNFAALRRIRPRPAYQPPAANSPMVVPMTVGGPFYRLADYLEQHGRRTRAAVCPPASFWYAAHNHLTHPGELQSLADAARRRYRLQWAEALYFRAIAAGSSVAPVELVELREEIGDFEGAECLVQRAASTGDNSALFRLAHLRKDAGDLEGAELLLQRAVDAGNIPAFVALADMRQGAGDLEGAELLLQCAVDAGNIPAFVALAELKENAGDLEGAERLAQRAADVGNFLALGRLASLRQRAGDQESVERLLQPALDAGDFSELVRIAVMSQWAGDQESAEHLYQRAADAGEVSGLVQLAVLRQGIGDLEGAELLFQRAAEAGSISALTPLAELRENAGDFEGAERLVQRAASAGDNSGLVRLVELREEVGDIEGVERLFQQASDAGTTFMLVRLGVLRREIGDLEGAQDLFQRAADAGSIFALSQLAVLRESFGDQEGAETLAQRAADAGRTSALGRIGVLRARAGDPDGAERMFLRAAEAGDIFALVQRAEMRERVGDLQEAEHLALHAADGGVAFMLVRLARFWEKADIPEKKFVLKYGLNPDGTPVQPLGVTSLPH